MMKRLLLLLASGGALMCADLADVRTVYVLPMSHGLDQYLANRLTHDHVFMIVTDPKLADAVPTERAGTGLQAKLADLLQPPPTEKPAPKGDDKDKDAPAKSPASLAETIGQ